MNAMEEITGQALHEAYLKAARDLRFVQRSWDSLTEEMKQFYHVAASHLNKMAVARERDLYRKARAKALWDELHGLTRRYGVEVEFLPTEYSRQFALSGTAIDFQYQAYSASLEGLNSALGLLS